MSSKKSTVASVRDEIALTEADHRPHAADIRAAVDAANEALHDRGEQIHIGNIRPLLPPWASGPQVGARITGHVRRKALQWTGEFALNGNTRTRNALRPCKVYRLVKALED